MKHKEEFITEEKVINTPAGGVLIGKEKEGQTIIHNDGSLGGFLIGRLHKDGGIKAVNKATGQPLEMQSNEIVITAPAVADTTKRNFEGKMMTNREILSKINSDGGGVSFADGGDIPAKIHTTDKEYEYGGKMVHDSDIANHLGMNSTLKKGKQQFSSGGNTYDVDAIYNAIKKGKIAYKTKDVTPFAMKYPVYDKKYNETAKIDFRKPNGITVRTESGEEVLIDGNHRMNNAYLKGRKTMKTYYIEDPKEIAKFIKKSRLISDKYKNKMASSTAKKEIRSHYNMRGDAFDDRKDSENWTKYSLPYDTRFDIEFENGGHLSKNKSLKQIAEMHNVSLTHINEELAKGLEVEKEHFADFKERTRVAKDHLVENPNYYTILAKAGLENGGKFDSKPFLDYYFEEIKDFLKYQNDIKLKDDFTFIYNRGELFTIEPLIKADKSLDEKIKTVDFIILDSENDVVGEISFEADNKKKFNAYSQFFDWNNIKFDNGGSISQRYLKNGGDLNPNHKNEENLVKDAKNGNTPARDLNNYNDIMDLEADGMVGMESGLAFADGGNIDGGIQVGDLFIMDLPDIWKNKDYGRKRQVAIVTNIDNPERVLIYNGRVYFNIKETSLLSKKKSSISEVLNEFRNKNNMSISQDLKGIINLLSKEVISQKTIDLLKERYPNRNVYALNSDNEKTQGVDCYTISITPKNLTDKRTVIEKINGYYLITQINFKQDYYYIFDSIEDAINLKYGQPIYANGGNVNFWEKEDVTIVNGDYGKLAEVVPSYKDDTMRGRYFVVFRNLNGKIVSFEDNFETYSLALEYAKENVNNDEKYANGGELDLNELLEMVKSDKYVDGGATNLPKVEKIIITRDLRTDQAYKNLIDTEYYNFEDLKEAIKKAYDEEMLLKPTKTNNGGYEFKVNDTERNTPTFFFYFNNKKNTVANFNPSTGKATDLQKQLLKNKKITYSKYDWTEFFGGASNNTVGKGMSVDGVNVIYLDTNGKDKVIQFVGNPIQLYNFLKKLYNDGSRYAEVQPLGSNFVVDGISIPITNGVWQDLLFVKPEKEAVEAIKYALNLALFPKLDFTKFNNRYTTITNSTTSAKPLLTDLSDTKIFIGDNPELSKRVQERAFELGWGWGTSRNTITPEKTYDTCLFFSDTKYISSSNERGVFDRSSKKEIFADDLFSSATPASAKTQPFDFTDTKIDVSNRPELRLKVQKRAFELGWEWENRGGKTLDYDDFNYLYFTKQSISNGFTPISFVNSPKREITEADIFGNQTPANTIVNQGSNLAPYEASQVTLNWENNQGINQKANFYTDSSIGTSGKGLINFLKDIEKNSNGKDVEVTIKAYAQDNNGKEIERITEFNIGQNWFRPSVRTNEQIKSIVENDWIDGITFDKFFEDAIPLSGSQTPTPTTVVPKISTVKKFTDFKEVANKLEQFALQASEKYSDEIYDDSLDLLKEVKEQYSLALSFTPESSFMYERIELIKKIAEVQKEITRISELKNGGAYYILSKVIERLEKGEDWKDSVGEILTNEVPQQEIDAVIHTDKFKNWFGNWEEALITKENDYVSKAVNEDGKPSVMYHGAKRIKYSYRQVSNGVLYLAENRSYAEWFSANESQFQKQGDYLTQCFVNLKNPIDLTPLGVEELDLRDIIQFIDALYPLAKIYDVLTPNIAMAIMNNNLIGGQLFRAWNIIRQYPKLNQHIRDNTSYDGFIYYENNPSNMIINQSTGNMEQNITKATAVFNSNQVKLVDAMLFNSSLDDWRFEIGGKVN